MEGGPAPSHKPPSLSGAPGEPRAAVRPRPSPSSLPSPTGPGGVGRQTSQLLPPGVRRTGQTTSARGQPPGSRRDSDRTGPLRKMSPERPAHKHPASWGGRMSPCACTCVRVHVCVYQKGEERPRGATGLHLATHSCRAPGGPVGNSRWPGSTARCPWEGPRGPRVAGQEEAQSHPTLLPTELAGGVRG